MQQIRFTALAALAASLLLSACATGPVTTSAAPASSPDNPMSGQFSASATPAGVAQRELTPQEKKAIMDAVAPSLRNPNSAKYRWAKFPAVVTESSVNYCATVEAGSPYAAYNGLQAYIVEANVSGGHVTGATMGLIAGGKDFNIVSTMCAKYGLDPRRAG